MRVALLPIGFGVGALLCRILLKQTPSVYSVDLAQPLAVVTYWQHFGLLMWLALFVAIAIASVGYWATLTRPPGVLTIVTVSALSCAAALAFPVIFSSDVYAYGGYGWLALHGVSPYAHAEVLARNQLMDAVLWQWGDPPPVCVYGPAFVWFAQAIVAAFQSLGPAATLWAFRIAACAALVACAPLAFLAFPERSRSAAAAGIALNPIAIWCCAEGHNDVYVLVIALAGFALAARARAFSGGLLLALSALVKIPGLLAAAAAPLIYSRDSRFPRLLAGIAVGIVLCAVAGRPALTQLLHAKEAPHFYFPQFSLQYVFASLTGTGGSIALTAVLAVSFAAGGVVLALKKRAFATALLAFALWIVIPDPYPWYALWILPLAFVSEGAGAWAIVALTLCTVLRYLPDATTELPEAANVFIAIAPLAAAAAAFICSRRLRQVRPENLTPVPDPALSRWP